MRLTYEQAVLKQNRLMKKGLFVAIVPNEDGTYKVEQRTRAYKAPRLRLIRAQ